MYCFSICCRLPIPEPMITPQRYGSSFSISNPASAHASFAAATAYWENVSILFDALKSIRSFATKSLTSAAIFTLYSVVSNFVIGPIPTVPFLIPFQNSSTVLPIGVIAPSPVITTLRFILPPFVENAGNVGCVRLCTNIPVDIQVVQTIPMSLRNQGLCQKNFHNPWSLLSIAQNKMPTGIFVQSRTQVYWLKRVFHETFSVCC